MSALVETLYPLPDQRRTPLSMLRWWESRRLRYNLVVGSTGLVTLTVVTIIASITPGMGGPPLQMLLIGPLFYAIAANVCYSLGWVIEMLAKAVWGSQAPRMGPLLFREGLIFSVGLTLLPILIVIWGAIVQMVTLVL